MSTQVVSLYALVVLIWGSTWIAITYQLGPVAPERSVAYRFGLASLLLFAYAAVRRQGLTLPAHRYWVVIVMGVLMYSGSYMIVYHGASYISSGLVAVVFSLIVVTNAFFERVFFGRPLESRLMLASALGVFGIVCLFWPEVATFSFQDRTIVGVLLVASGVLVAGLGNMAAIDNTARGLNVVAVNAHAMAWGTLSSALTGTLLGRPFAFSFETGYVVSLLYLAVLGSALAFGIYLVLIKTIGSARAAYTAILFPIVALGISTIFEGYRWSALTVAGMTLVVAGNWLALTKIARESS